MGMVLGWLQSGLTLVGPFIILITLTVFVHELGHFLVARFFGVRVEVFSIGMGKKIWTRRYGDTEYAVSLFPIGGYVKMFGDQLGVDVDPEQKQFSFVHKPVLQRIAVVLAGPVMNLIFAVILFIFIAMVGEEQKAPVVGDLIENSAAYQVGFRSGDTILSIGEKSVRTWTEMQNEFDQSVGHELTLKVKHLDGVEQILKMTPNQLPDNGVLSLSNTMGGIEGLTNLASGAGIGISNKESWAYRVGFRTGDFISKVNGTEVKYWRDAEARIINGSYPLKITVIRMSDHSGAAANTTEKTNDKEEKFGPFEFEVSLKPDGQNFAELGLERGELFLSKVMPKSPAEAAGLVAGDKLLEVQGLSVKYWDQVQTAIKNFKSEDKTVRMKVLREGKPVSVEITPVMTSTKSSQGLQEDRFTVGISPWLFMSIPEFTTVRYGLSFDAVSRGIQRSWEVTAMTVLSFVKLFKAEISPKNISGFISIGEIAMETFKMGWGQFFGMMGVISINLFILNLMPIPVLDGGHMVFYTIELLKGAPLSLRKIEMAQRFGIVVLMSLMIFALFNDISRKLGF